MTKIPDTWADLTLVRFGGGTWGMGPMMTEHVMM